MSDYKTTKAQCIKKDEFWEDPDFKAEQTSIYYKRENWMPDWSKVVVWKRPAVSIFSIFLYVESSYAIRPTIISEQNIWYQNGILLYK